MKTLTDILQIAGMTIAGAIALVVALYWLLKVLDGCRRAKDNQDRIMDRHIMPKRERGEG
jgi:hypothetical protein